MRLGIPSLLKIGTYATIRVSKRLHSRLLTYSYTCSHYMFSYFGSFISIVCFGSHTHLLWWIIFHGCSRDLHWIALFLPLFPCLAYGSITFQHLLDPCIYLLFLLPSSDCHVDLWHSWTSRCTLGYSWSSHLCSTTTEFGWTGLQCWPWKYWWSSNSHSISYEWDS